MILYAYRILLFLKRTNKSVGCAKTLKASSQYEIKVNFVILQMSMSYISFKEPGRKGIIGYNMYTLVLFDLGEFYW